MKKDKTEITTQILDQVIKMNGAQIKTIAAKLGLTRPTIYRYLKEPSRFASEQLDILAKEIGLERETLDKILSGKIDTIQKAIKNIN